MEGEGKIGRRVSDDVFEGDNEQLKGVGGLARAKDAGSVYPNFDAEFGSSGRGAVCEEGLKRQAVELVGRGKVCLKDTSAGTKPGEQLGDGSLGRVALPNGGTPDAFVEGPTGEAMVLKVGTWS